jgi:hypothetical protein
MQFVDRLACLSTSRLSMARIFTGENESVGIDGSDASIFAGEERADSGTGSQDWFFGSMCRSA